jgi:hypothetical protein
LGKRPLASNALYIAADNRAEIHARMVAVARTLRRHTIVHIFD